MSSGLAPVSSAVIITTKARRKSLCQVIFSLRVMRYIYNRSAGNTYFKKKNRKRDVCMNEDTK